MVLEIKKQPNETSQNLIRRFSKNMKRSGILKRVRKTRSQQKKKSKQMRKKSALRREELRKEYEETEKMSKIKEEFNGRYKTRN